MLVAGDEECWEGSGERVCWWCPKADGLSKFGEFLVVVDDEGEYILLLFGLSIGCLYFFDFFSY